LITIYSSSGAQDFELLSISYSQAELKTLIFNAERLLRHRGFPDAAKALASTDFQVWEATNSFSDDFSALFAEVPLDRYESFRAGKQGGAADYASVAEVFRELGTYIRFVACELKLEKAPGASALSKLTPSEILKLVNEYIGVSGGYLGEFSYKTHRDFYPQFCNLDISPDEYQGTTRERFIHILQSCAGETQAKILRGILAKYPVGETPRLPASALA
jgi:hypothetical protein